MSNLTDIKMSCSDQGSLISATAYLLNEGKETTIVDSYMNHIYMGAKKRFSKMSFKNLTQGKTHHPAITHSVKPG